MGPFVALADVRGLAADLPRYTLSELPRPVYRIADALKRWNDVDGFYHA